MARRKWERCYCETVRVWDIVPDADREVPIDAGWQSVLDDIAKQAGWQGCAVVDGPHVERRGKCSGMDEYSITARARFPVVARPIVSV